MSSSRDQHPGISAWLGDAMHVEAHPDNDADFEVEKFALDERIKSVLYDMEMDVLFPVQKAVLDHSLKARDVCVCAPTGSGKTLAYLLPILQGLANRKTVRLRALIIVPGRELALQVQTVLFPFAKALGLRMEVAIGQCSFLSEQKRLVEEHKAVLAGGTSRIDILIATPGRLLDHLENTVNFTLQHVEWLVLDEADRLLDSLSQEWLRMALSSLDPWKGTKPIFAAGMADTVSYRRPQDTLLESLLWVTPVRKILCSATLTRNPAKLVPLHLNEPIYVTVSGDASLRYSLPKELSTFMHVCEEDRKPVAVLHLLNTLKLTRSLCFVKSIEAADRLAVLLQRASANDRIVAFTGELASSKRAQVLQRFQNGEIDLLVCSDAAARGLDLSEVASVINYNVPRFVKTYIHRVGRTARAGKSGSAYTVLAVREAYHFKEMLAKAGLEKPAVMKIPKISYTEIMPRYKKAMASLKCHPTEKTIIINYMTTV